MSWTPEQELKRRLVLLGLTRKVVNRVRKESADEKGRRQAGS